MTSKYAMQTIPVAPEDVPAFESLISIWDEYRRRRRAKCYVAPRGYVECAAEYLAEETWRRQQIRKQASEKATEGDTPRAKPRKPRQKKTTKKPLKKR